MQCVHSVCAACVTCLALLPSEPLWAVTYHQVHTLSARPTVVTNIDHTGLEVWGDQLSLCVNEQCICYTYPPILVRTYMAWIPDDTFTIVELIVCCADYLVESTCPQSTQEHSCMCCWPHRHQYHWHTVGCRQLQGWGTQHCMLLLHLYRNYAHWTCRCMIISMRKSITTA